MNKNKISQQIQILINQFNAKNYENVIIKSRTLIKKNYNLIILYNLLGSSYQNIGDYVNAENIFTEGLKLDPRNIPLKNNLAMIYKNLLIYEKSEKLFREIIKENKNYINAYVNLGNLKRDLNDFNEAIELYKKAFEIDENNQIVNYSLALAYQGLGKFEDAVIFAKKTLKINPSFTRADNLISQSVKYDKNNKHYYELKEKLKILNLTNDEKIELYFAIAKAEEDMGNIEEAYINLEKGNSLKRKITNYNINNELKLFEDIKIKFKKNNLKHQISKENDKKIIFILGMPRSGTSLVEQIISSHENVFGAGELPILSNIIKENFIEMGQLSEAKLNDIINDTKKIENLYNKYYDFIKNFKFKETYITDKAPLNFRWIGFIKLLFPKAKIIHCTRDKLDNWLSMYKNLFEGGLNFTYSQEDIKSYYNGYSNLILFWKSLYPELIYEVKYENLVENKTQEIEKILNYCELSWDENCLSFHKNKTPIKTMSTAQARKPIYKSSIKSFEKFKNFLTILNKDA